MSTKTRVGVEVRNGNFEKALSIFKKKVRRSGILQEYKENQEFKKPSTVKREAKRKKEYNLRKNES